MKEHPVAQSEITVRQWLPLIGLTCAAFVFNISEFMPVGLSVSWRMTFCVAGAVSAAVLAYQAVVFPAMPAGERFTLGQLPSLMRNRALLTLYAVTISMSCSYYVGYSYIEPFMQQVAHLDADVITMALTVFGFACLLGSVSFSRFFDRRRFCSP